MQLITMATKKQQVIKVSTIAYSQKKKPIVLHIVTCNYVSILILKFLNSLLQNRR